MKAVAGQADDLLITNRIVVMACCTRSAQRRHNVARGGPEGRAESTSPGSQSGGWDETGAGLAGWKVAINRTDMCHPSPLEGLRFATK